MIPVTKPYLPSREKLQRYIDGIYDRGWLTNDGVLVKELTKRLEEYLGVDNLLLVANGTLALQVAYRALGVTQADRSSHSEAVTTPFTFVATASSLSWEGVHPVFSDIDAATWCIDPGSIRDAISDDTKVIVPVHVFGNACSVREISSVAQQKNIKTVYDASHAFAVQSSDGSILKHGDASTLSFHATKLFHTAEGGAIVFNRKEDLERAKRIINFGITGPESIEGLGINAKMNELQAAMGLCVLDEMETNLAGREEVWSRYENTLNGFVELQQRNDEYSNNYSYFPVLMKDSKSVANAMDELRKNGILARRYFYPLLSNVDTYRYPKNDLVEDLHNANDISQRVICLPIYCGLTRKEQEGIVAIVKRWSGNGDT